jgi:hypothetical protein
MENCDILAIFLFALILFWVIVSFGSEGFSADGTEFLPVGQQRYGLRGEPIHSRPISDYYIRPDRNIRLDPSGGLMYESNFPPMKEHSAHNCDKMNCPTVGYDSTDTCWSCKN